MADATTGSLERRVAELSTLNAIGEILNREADFAAALGGALSKLVELLALRSGWVFLTQVVQGDTHQGALTLAATAGLPPALSADANRALCSGSCDCQWRFRQGQLDTGVNIVRCSRLEGATGDKAGLELHASVPLLGRAGPVGILNLAAAGRAPFDAGTLAFLTAVGRQLGTAFERAELLRARTEAARHLATLEERQRVATEMHDSVAQLLFAAELALQVAKTGPDDAARSGGLAQAERLVGGALAELRALVEVLRPADLSGGLARALARLAERTGGALAVHLELDRMELPEAHAELLYRAAQEALHNTLRHASATTVWLRVARSQWGVTLSVEDDGRGPPESPTEGFGLATMRGRAAGLGGRVTLGHRTPRGARLELVLPYD
jgi:two-component system, NarL family, sensor kinase